LFTLRGGWGANVRWQNAHLRFDPPDYAQHYEDSSGVGVPFLVPHGLYNLWGASGGFNTPNRALSFGAGVSLGGEAAFDEASRAVEFAASASLSWRPTDALRVEASWVHQRLARSSDGSQYSLANIPRLKLEYQLSRSLFIRYVGQYVAQEQAALVSPTTGRPLRIGSPTAPISDAQTQNDFRNDLLLSFRPTPGTVFFLGYGTSLTETDSFEFSDLSRTSDGVFIKASYLFRL